MTGKCQPPEFAVDPWEDGCVFLVRAHPGARREGLAGIHDGMLKVEVTAAPEKGKANKAIAKLLAKTLGVATGAIVLLSGDTNSRKRFGVRMLTPEKVLSKLMPFLQ